jgi:hypothetical protein
MMDKQMYAVRVFIDGWIYVTDERLGVKTWEDFDEVSKLAHSWRLSGNYYSVAVVPYP